MGPGVDAVIMTRNEECNIAGAIDSALKVTDSVIVLDCGSTDRTQSIAAAHGAKVVCHEFEGFGAQMQFGLGLGEREWVLFLDADERIGDGLAVEIKRAICERRNVDGYRLRRITYIGLVPLRHGGWYPDLTLRLVRRERARCDGAIVHQQLLVGRVASLRTPMDHFSYRNVDHYLDKLKVYTALEVYRRSARSTTFRARLFRALPAKAVVRFAWRYLFLGGWRDDLGLEMAVLSAAYDVVVDMKVQERQAALGSPHGS